MEDARTGSRGDASEGQAVTDLVDLAVHALEDIGEDGSLDSSEGSTLVAMHGSMADVIQGSTIDALGRVDGRYFKRANGPYIVRI
jgi:hypothetical protein